MPRRRAPTDPKLAVAYCRVSTDDQSLGADAQLSAIERWATAQGITIVSVHRDIGVSGAAEVADRPAMLEALATLERHAAGVLVVAKRDRLARDLVIAASAEQLVRRVGASIVSADGVGAGDGPEGMLMRGLVDLFAAYERALIRSRTRAALSQKRQRGERTGGVPLGSRLAPDGRQLDACDVEQRAVTRIAELRAQGASLRGIVEVLNYERVPARGRKWHVTSVVRVLRRSTAA